MSDQIDTGVATVILSGDLTIHHAEELRDRLSSALAGGRSVAIDCSGSAEVDLSFLQLLVAARRSAEAAGKGFSVITGEGPLLAALRRAGFVPDGAAEPEDLWLLTLAKGAA